MRGSSSFTSMIERVPFGILVIVIQRAMTLHRQWHILMKCRGMPMSLIAFKIQTAFFFRDGAGRYKVKQIVNK